MYTKIQKFGISNYFIFKNTFFLEQGCLNLTKTDNEGITLQKLYFN